MFSLPPDNDQREPDRLSTSYFPLFDLAEGENSWYEPFVCH